MPKRLSGSAGTGKKIMENWNLFQYNYNGTENLAEGKILYKFTWLFDDYQKGDISIEVTGEGRICDSSLINCRRNQREFNRALGMYNDRSLEAVFQMMLNSCKKQQL